MWSLIIGRGACEVLPLRKEGVGAEKAYADERGAKSFHSLKGGARKVSPCLEGGGGAHKVSDPRF